MGDHVSLWADTQSLPAFPTLEQDVTTDVLIIGGGLAGLLCAYFLCQNGVDCLLVEQDRIGGGTTHNTTAKITVQHGLMYHKLIKDRGEEIAKGYWMANKKAFDTYAQLCQRIDCDYEVKDNYVYSVNDRRKLEQELTALERIGCEAHWCDRVPIPISTVGAVCVPHQAQFHPLEFIAAIAQGLPIYENTKVREMIGNTAVTQHGRIKAKSVIVATHFPFINKHGNYFLKLYQHRSYVLALQGAQELSGMYVDESDTGFSFRKYQDLLLLGGGGHRTGKKGGSFSVLERFRDENYPYTRICYGWAAQDCMSLDAVPYIGQYSASTKRLYVATGFNKWGMTGSMVAAQLLCEALMGTKSEFADVFDPSRSILKPQLLVNGFESLTNLLTPTAKRCPHLGCALKWNPYEHSWDCPCHGSRFTHDGKNLDGPATSDLKQ